MLILLTCRGKQLSGSVSYLSKVQEIQAKKQWNPSLEDDIPSLGSLIEALQWLAVSQIASVGIQLQEEISSGKSPEVAWNDNMMQAVSASRYNYPVCHYRMLFTCFHKCKNIKTN